MSTFLPIPSAQTATDPILCTADLHQRWRALMGPLGFRERRLWLGFVGADRRMVTTLIHMPVGRCPDRRTVLDLLVTLSGAVTERGEPTTVAMLLSRPGRDRPGTGDRRWARVLDETARRAGVAIEPIFLANDRAIEQIGDQVR